MADNTNKPTATQVSGDCVALLAADRGPGNTYRANLDELIARQTEAWAQGYASGYAEGRTDRAAEAAHRAMCADLRAVWDGPTVTPMDGTADELRARAVARERAAAQRIRASIGRGGAA